MVKQSAGTFLPSPLVYVTGFGIAIGEAVIGTCPNFGIFLRPTLVVGKLLMLLFIFGRSHLNDRHFAAYMLIV